MRNISEIQENVHRPLLHVFGHQVFHRLCLVFAGRDVTLSKRSTETTTFFHFSFVSLSSTACKQSCYILPILPLTHVRKRKGKGRTTSVMARPASTRPPNPAVGGTSHSFLSHSFHSVYTLTFLYTLTFRLYTQHTTLMYFGLHTNFPLHTNVPLRTNLPLHTTYNTSYTYLITRTITRINNNIMSYTRIIYVLHANILWFTH